MIKAEPANVAIHPSTPVEEKDVTAELRQIVANPGFPQAAAVGAIIIFLFWSFLSALPGLWFAPDSAFSQGPLVPFLAGYILLTRWEEIKRIPAKGSWVPLVFLLPLLYIVYIATRTQMMFVLSFAFVATIGLTAWMAAGFRAALAAAPAFLYLLFGLPVWQQIVDKFTQPMQVISSEVSYAMLKGMGYEIYRPDSTTVMLDRFQFVVGAPCSGLKTTIALLAFTVLFILIARLKVWANVLLAAFIIPFAILINALRIAMIGWVGNTWGNDAGMKFHDYSGYLALVVCFVTLRSVCRALGWK
ncbi:hypothetical protein BH11ARM2_BH11ARM2_01560 [soil metagenome]